MAAIDDLTAAIGDLETAATAVEAEVKALQAGSDQSALAALTARVRAVVKALAGLAVPLAVSPPSVASPVGQAISDALVISGGVAPYSASSSLGDLSVSVTDTSLQITGTPAAAETGEITVTDSTTPTPQTVVVPVTIS